MIDRCSGREGSGEESVAGGVKQGAGEEELGEKKEWQGRGGEKR